MKLDHGRLIGHLTPKYSTGIEKEFWRYSFGANVNNVVEFFTEGKRGTLKCFIAR